MHSFVVTLFVDDVNKREKKETSVFVIFFCKHLENVQVYPTRYIMTITLQPHS